jgi:phosphatidylinositol 3-kinase
MVKEELLLSLEQTKKGQEILEILKDQENLLQQMDDMCRACLSAGSGASEMKTKLLRSLKPGGDFSHLTKLEPTVVNPLNPSQVLKGVIAEHCFFFKSNTKPMKIAFDFKDYGVDETKKRSKASKILGDPVRESGVIYKIGDDMRQDQLIIQFINLIDRRLKTVNLDLCLTPYRVLATSQDTGLMFCIPGVKTLLDVLQNGGIQAYLRQHNPMDGAEFGINPTAMDTFVRSCAGYCVITYILGVGDRHLENLVMQPDGHFFHLDFGYILGNDPKPWPAAMRITKPMIAAMGGLHHHNFQRFTLLACSTFSILRKSASLILNMLELMVDAGIADLSHRPTLGPDMVLRAVEEKFVLHLSEEDADEHLRNIVQKSANASAPLIYDKIHDIARLFL